MGIKFEFFEAGCGDSILVSTGNGTNILIDGGFGRDYKTKISKKIAKVDTLHLVVLTHMDQDHICGVIEMVKNHKKDREKIQELWFNSMSSVRVRQNKNVPIGYGNAELFDKLLKKYDVPNKDNIFLTNEFEKREYSINKEIKLTLLSPLEEDVIALEKQEPENQRAEYCNNREAKNIGRKKVETKDVLLNQIDVASVKFAQDTELSNRSSIAFILKYKSKQFLFLGDAHIDVINVSLRNLGFSKNKKLEVEFVKLSHHGSKNNINVDFLDIVQTDKFIVLTDGKDKNNNHPNKEVFKLILEHIDYHKKNIKFSFNYESLVRKKISLDEEREYFCHAVYENILKFKELK